MQNVCRFYRQFSTAESEEFQFSTAECSFFGKLSAMKWKTCEIIRTIWRKTFVFVEHGTKKSPREIATTMTVKTWPTSFGARLPRTLVLEWSKRCDARKPLRSYFSASVTLRCSNHFRITTENAAVSIENGLSDYENEFWGCAIHYWHELWLFYFEGKSFGWIKETYRKHFSIIW